MMMENPENPQADEQNRPLQETHLAALDMLEEAMQERGYTDMAISDYPMMQLVRQMTPESDRAAVAKRLQELLQIIPGDQDANRKRISRLMSQVLAGDTGLDQSGPPRGLRFLEDEQE